MHLNMPKAKTHHHPLGFVARTLVVDLDSNLLVGDVGIHRNHHKDLDLVGNLGVDSLPVDIPPVDILLDDILLVDILLVELRDAIENNLYPDFAVCKKVVLEEYTHHLVHSGFPPK